jgi:hypothetical protein
MGPTGPTGPKGDPVLSVSTLITPWAVQQSATFPSNPTWQRELIEPTTCNENGKPFLRFVPNNDPSSCGEKLFSVEIPLPAHDHTKPLTARITGAVAITELLEEGSTSGSGMDLSSVQFVFVGVEAPALSQNAETMPPPQVVGMVLGNSFANDVAGTQVVREPNAPTYEAGNVVGRTFKQVLFTSPIATLDPDGPLVAADTRLFGFTVRRYPYALPVQEFDLRVRIDPNIQSSTSSTNGQLSTTHVHAIGRVSEDTSSGGVDVPWDPWTKLSFVMLGGTGAQGKVGFFYADVQVTAEPAALPSLPAPAPSDGCDGAKPVCTSQ